MRLRLGEHRLSIVVEAPFRHPSHSNELPGLRDHGHLRGSERAYEVIGRGRREDGLKKLLPAVGLHEGNLVSLAEGAYVDLTRVEPAKVLHEERGHPPCELHVLEVLLRLRRLNEEFGELLVGQRDVQIEAPLKESVRVVAPGDVVGDEYELAEELELVGGLEGGRAAPAHLAGAPMPRTRPSGSLQDGHGRVVAKEPRAVVEDQDLAPPGRGEGVGEEGRKGGVC